MFKIRSPVISDLEKLKGLFKEKPFLATINSNQINKIASLLQPLIPTNLRFLPSLHIAVDEKNILGYIVLKCASKANNCWQIDEVFVFDEVRNSGIGEELLRYALSLYGSQGVEHFLAEVDAQNLPALSLFHSCGFMRYAKVGFYEKEINVESLPETPTLKGEFIIRPQTKNDLTELEKIDLSSIPPDLRGALGRSKEYFKDKINSYILINKSRNLVIGWFQVLSHSSENYFIEILLSPGWTHLYEQFLNTIILDHISIKQNKFKLSIKAIDYLTDLTEILTKLGYLRSEVKELLVRTIWQKIKEKGKKRASVSVPGIAPT